MFMTDITLVYNLSLIPLSAPSGSMLPAQSQTAAPQNVQNQTMQPEQTVFQPIQNYPNNPDLQLLSEKPPGYVDLQDAIDGVKQFAALPGEALSAVKDKIAESGIKEKAAVAAEGFKDSTGQVLDAVRIMGQTARDKLINANIKGKAADAAGNILAFSGDTVSSAKEKIAETTENTKEKATSIGYFFRGLFEAITEKLHALFHREHEEKDENILSVSSEESEKAAANHTVQIVLIAAIAVVLAGGGVAAGLLLTKKNRQNDTSASVSQSTAVSAAQQSAANSQSAKLEALLQAYTEVLRSFMRSSDYISSDYDYECSKYDLADLNSDGIPELIISKFDYGCCDLYTYANGQALHLLENAGEGGQICYLPNQQTVLDIYSQYGYAEMNVYSFTQNEFRRLKTMEGAYPDNAGDEPPYFKIDGVYVQEQDFEAEFNRYSFNAKYVGRQYSFPAAPEQLQLKVATN